MTAQILAAELGNLVQESKRKNSELRNAAEQSLQDLKSLPQTSEAQLAAGKPRYLVGQIRLMVKEISHGAHISLHLSSSRVAHIMRSLHRPESPVSRDSVSQEPYPESD